MEENQLYIHRNLLSKFGYGYDERIDSYCLKYKKFWITQENR